MAESRDRRRARSTTTASRSCTPTCPGAFSRVAGVLSLHGLDVLTAWAHSDEPQLGHWAMAASEFRVDVPARGRSTGSRSSPTCGGPSAASWRSRPASPSGPSTYRRRRAMQAAPPGPPSVMFHDEASSNATVIEVRAPDQDRHPPPHHQGARRARPRHPPRHRADDRRGGRRHVLRAHVVGRAGHRRLPPRRDRARRPPRRRLTGHSW